MSDPEHELKPILDHLKQLAGAAQKVWAAYQNVGPSRVEKNLYDDVGSAANAIKKLLTDSKLSECLNRHLNVEESEIRDAVEMLRDLCYRCACTPMGLCFVAGEAGLIPRKDQHDAFCRCLTASQDWCES